MRELSRPAGSALAFAVLVAVPAAAQEAPDDPPAAGDDVRAELGELRDRNEELAVRLDLLEQGQLESTGLNVRYGSVYADFKLFGNVNYAYMDPAEERAGSELGDNAFELGVLDFFFTAQIDDDFQVLSETKAEGGGAGASLDQERLWGSYRHSEGFYVKMGLEHSEISRWNRLYHHGAWLELTIQRPFLARFEGDGGILPMHNAGLEVGGSTALDSGMLDWFAILSNGRGEDPASKQKAEDVNDAKAVELGLAFEPGAVDGLRFGSAVRFDDVDPSTGESMDELIASAYVDWRSGPWETLTEFAYIHDDVSGDGDSYHNTGYLQVGRRSGSWTPYARIDYKNMDEGNPFYRLKDRDLDAWQQTLGVRYDFNPYASLKLELGLGRAEQRDGTTGEVSSEDTTFFGFQLSWAI